MANSDEILKKTVVVAAGLPGVHIDRGSYLRATLRRFCPADQVDEAVEKTPADANVSTAVINQAAKSAIRLETTRVSSISAVAGIPGGFAMVGTVPVDAAQYFGHMIRISQKLAYLYGWPDLFDEEGQMDDATLNLLILFLGVMMGVNAANAGISQVAKMLADQALKQLPKQALTKGVIYPIVKKVAAQLGVTMTKQIFARGVAKTVPILGGILSGGMTLALFAPMSRKLQRHLASAPIVGP